MRIQRMSSMVKLATIKIPLSLKQEIEYYLTKNKDYDNFSDFVISNLKHGVQDLIHGTLKKEEHSFRCRHSDPKTTRRVYKILEDTHEYFLCDKCRIDPVFEGYELEDKIKWGDFV